MRRRNEVLYRAAVLGAALAASWSGVPGRSLAADLTGIGEGPWRVVLASKGGNLLDGERRLEIQVDGTQATGIETLTPTKGQPTTRKLSIAAKAVSELEKTMVEVDAWKLDDFDREGLDSPEYTIRLEREGASRAISVRGASQSDRHLRLIRSIQNCFEKGGP